MAGGGWLVTYQHDLSSSARSPGDRIEIEDCGVEVRLAVMYDATGGSALLLV
jgi:hypothetical protein